MGENADSSGPSGPCKAGVAHKNIHFLSNMMEQDPELQIYTTDIMDVFKEMFSDSANQDDF